MMAQLFSHPFVGTPVAIAAVANPYWMDHITNGLPIVLQILGGIFLVMQIFYLYKNKGKK